MALVKNGYVKTFVNNNVYVAEAPQTVVGLYELIQFCLIRNVNNTNVAKYLNTFP